MFERGTSSACTKDHVLQIYIVTIEHLWESHHKSIIYSWSVVVVTPSQMFWGLIISCEVWFGLRLLMQLASNKLLITTIFSACASKVTTWCFKPTPWLWEVTLLGASCGRREELFSLPFPHPEMPAKISDSHCIFYNSWKKGSCMCRGCRIELKSGEGIWWTKCDQNFNYIHSTNCSDFSMSLLPWQLQTNWWATQDMRGFNVGYKLCKITAKASFFLFSSSC